MRKLTNNIRIIYILRKKFILGPSKSFYINSFHPQISKTGSSWLLKYYTDQDFLKFYSSLVISS